MKRIFSKNYFKWVPAFLLSVAIFLFVLHYILSPKLEKFSGVPHYLTFHTYEAAIDSGKLVLVTENKTYDLDIKNTISYKLDSPQTFSGILKGNTIQVQSVSSYSGSVSKIDSAHAEQASTGIIKPLIILTNFNNDKSTPFDKTQIYENIFGTQSSVKSYFSEASFGKSILNGSIDSIVGWYSIPSNNTGCDLYTWADQAKYVAKSNNINVDNYSPIIIVFPRTQSCSATINGVEYPTEGTADFKKGLVWMNGNIGVRPISHEIVHTMGVGHAHKCKDGDYECLDSKLSITGDKSDLMGIYRNAPPSHLNSAFKGYLKWINQSQIATLRDKKQYQFDLFAVEKSPGNGSIMSIRAPILPPYYPQDLVLTYRSKSMGIFEQKAGIEDGLYIHRYTEKASNPDGIGSVPMTRLQKLLFTPGTYDDGKGVKIKANSFTKEKVNITIDYNPIDTAAVPPTPGNTNNPNTGGVCSGSDAKNMLSQTVSYCYGHAVSSVKPGCDLMSSALNAAYGPASLCESNANQCTSGDSSGICKAAPKFQQVTDWCYNTVQNNSQNAATAGVNASWCQNFAKITEAAHEDCNTCVRSSDGGGGGGDPGPTPSIIPIHGKVVDENGNGIPGVTMQIDGMGAAGYMKSYYPVTGPNGAFKQGGFIVYGGKYNVKIKGNETSPRTAPSGQKPPGRTSNNSHTKNTCDQKRDTELGSTAYMCQEAGFWDCATAPSKGCNFVYGNMPPSGFAERNGQQIRGTAVDASTHSSPVKIHIYLGIDGTTDKRFYSEILANQTGIPVNVQGNHTFYWDIPQFLKDDKEHLVYLYALDVEGRTEFNTLLKGAPVRVRINGATPSPAPFTTIIGHVRDRNANGVTGAKVRIRKQSAPGVDTNEFKEVVTSNGTYAFANFIRLTDYFAIRVINYMNSTIFSAFGTNQPALTKFNGQAYDYCRAGNTGQGEGLFNCQKGTNSCNSVASGVSGRCDFMLSADQAPTGSFDGLALDRVKTTTYVAWGWGRDPDHPNTPIQIHFYINKPAGQTGSQFIGSANASNNYSQTVGAHGFNFAIDPKYRTGAVIPLYVYAINSNGSGPNVLIGSKTFK